MLFLLTLNYQLINITNNDCYLPNYGLKFDTKEQINLQISCPKGQIQEINLVNYPNIKLISIHEESNVIISCFQSTTDTQQVGFNIFGKPTIAFNNSCNFSNIEIYDSPTFNLMRNSSFFVDSLILYNKKYQFPFPYKHVRYSQNVNNVKRSDDINYYNLTCEERLNIILNYGYATAKCDDYEPFTIFYTNMRRHTFMCDEIIVNIINKSSDKNDIYSNIKAISNSIKYIHKLYEKEVVKMINLVDFDDSINFTSFIDMFPVNTNFYAKLSNDYEFWCQNRDVSNADKFKILFDFGWKPLCISNKSYIHYVLTNKTYEIEFISKKTYKTLVVLVVVVIIVFLASIVLIVFCRFNSYKKKQKPQ